MARYHHAPATSYGHEYRHLQPARLDPTKTRPPWRLGHVTPYSCHGHSTTPPRSSVCLDLARSSHELALSLEPAPTSRRLHHGCIVNRSELSRTLDSLVACYHGAGHPIVKGKKVVVELKRAAGDRGDPFNPSTFTPFISPWAVLTPSKPNYYSRSSLSRIYYPLDNAST